MGRKIERLTLDHLDQLPGRCGDCVFWELDPVRRDAVRGHEAEEKAAWVSMVLREWGSCGRVALVDGEVVGHMIWAPPVHVPAADGFATGPISNDAVILATAHIAPEHRGGGLGRMLVQGMAKDLVLRGNIRAVEAFGDTRVARAIASYRLTSCSPWASPRTGRTRSTRACGWTCVRRSPSVRSSRRRWSGCSPRSSEP